MNMKRLLSGNEAIAIAAYEMGALARSYPGTPSTEILETLIKLDQYKARWCSNEKVAYEEALGLSYAGKRCMVSFKHVGLNNAADPLLSPNSAKIKQ